VVKTANTHLFGGSYFYYSKTEFDHSRRKILATYNLSPKYLCRSQFHERTRMSTPIPKGKGRRGEGIRTAGRRSGQSCAPSVDERWSGVDSDMLPSHDGQELPVRVSFSLSELAFFMDDAVFEEADAATRPCSEGGVPGESSTSRSPHENERRFVVAGVVTWPPHSGDLQHKPRGLHKDHEEGRWSTSRGGWDTNPFFQPLPRREDGTPPLKSERWEPRKGTPMPLVRYQDSIAPSRHQDTISPSRRQETVSLSRHHATISPSR